ncbi:hypothetical protein [Polynucleobacter brandtiae]|uniref:Transporter n=1 Tax=Polynucleobacter brandtiae TaxID=1938816 RepID=A0A2M8VZV2_9BURK|nr:hypothetical protein [Polynucleobacter brandtiae]PJI83397.1 hypothetical protein B0G85_0795 [Polynucleobacter brandtiae]
MILRTLTLVLLFGISCISFGAEDEGKYSEGFLRLDNVSQDYSRNHVLEFWGYHNSAGSSSSVDTLKLRYYQPIDLGEFKGTMRLDTAYNSSYGPNLPQHSAGQYDAGNTMLTVWGNHPGIFRHWGGNLGGRVIFPFGNNGQWAIGPQVGSSFVPPNGKDSILADFSPLIRYMYGFDGKNNSFANNPRQPPLVRTLQLFPTIGLQITPSTQLRLWDENGIYYNSAGGGWFVPLDAMVTQRVNKNFLYAVGASKQMVQTYNQYNWSLYGKVSFTF